LKQGRLSWKKLHTKLGIPSGGKENLIHHNVGGIKELPGEDYGGNSPQREKKLRPQTKWRFCHVRDFKKGVVCKKGRPCGKKSWGLNTSKKLQKKIPAELKEPGGGVSTLCKWFTESRGGRWWDKRYNPTMIQNQRKDWRLRRNLGGVGGHQAFLKSAEKENDPLWGWKGMGNWMRRTKEVNARHLL